MRRLKTLLSAILAGVCIGIGGTVYLNVENKVLGAFLFTLGLFVICTSKLHLYTGKVCYVFENDKDYALDIPVIWFGNLIGTNAVAFLMHFTRISANITEYATKACATKLTDDLLSIFILAIFCNMLIYIGVDGFNNIPHEVGKYLALFFGVVVFILCGFEHCIANMFYFGVAGVWSLRTVGYLLVMTAGNAVGGVFFPVMKNCIAKLNK